MRGSAEAVRTLRAAQCLAAGHAAEAAKRARVRTRARGRTMCSRGCSTRVDAKHIKKCDLDFSASATPTGGGEPRARADLAHLGANREARARPSAPSSPPATWAPTRSPCLAQFRAGTARARRRREGRAGAEVPLKARSHAPRTHASVRSSVSLPWTDESRAASIWATTSVNGDIIPFAGDAAPCARLRRPLGRARRRTPCVF